MHTANTVETSIQQISRDLIFPLTLWLVVSSQK